MYQRLSELSNIMNRFFVEKINNLIQKIPTTNKDPLKKIKCLAKSIKSQLDLKYVHPDDISKIIDQLKSSKSCGLDNIDTFVVKLAKHELVPAITHIINLSILQRKFPSQWKCAKVVPLFKKGDVSEPKNYRPVALLSVIRKIMERVIFNQIISYLEDNMILHPSHHGFRSRHSTCTALWQMQDLWLDALDKNEITAVIMCDMSAAFDLVNHSILLEKLALYGFCSTR